MTWDIDWVLWLNHLIGQDAQRFFLALFLSDRVPWVLSAMAFVWLWFRKSLFMERIREFNDHDPIYRHRIVVLSMVVASALAFMVVQPLAHALARPRPFQVLPLEIPIDPQLWAQVEDAVGRDNAFPSDHTTFWGALTIGIFLVSPGWGVVALVATGFFATLRVALGYHYPTDMFAGFAFGSLIFALVYLVRRHLRWLYHPLLLLFDEKPTLAYPLAALVLLDVTQRLAWLFGLLATLFGIYLPQ